jgi:Holliday junction DNA helicase RuvA
VTALHACRTAADVIAHLKGRLDATGIDYAVIDVGGVGYMVGASSRTLAAIGPVGEACTLHTEMLVAEDFIRLVGFARIDERDWFRLLTGVQGVGARVALAILSAFEPVDLSRAIAAQDKAMVARANGVGPKLAERIVRELKDKVGALGVVAGGAIMPAPSGAGADAVSAMLNLGFRPAEAANAVALAEDELGAGATLDALVRLALRKAAK